MNVSDSGDCHCETKDLSEFCMKYCELWNKYISDIDISSQPNTTIDGQDSHVDSGSNEPKEPNEDAGDFHLHISLPASMYMRTEKVF